MSGTVSERAFGERHQAKTESMESRVADLTAQKDRLHRQMRSLKEEVAEAETVKRCVEQTIPPTEQRKEKSKRMMCHCNPVGCVI